MKTGRFKSFNDNRGTLIPFDFSELPFIPNRMFWVDSVPLDTIRGNHAHYFSKQLLVCINGQVKVDYESCDRIGSLILTVGEWISLDNLTWSSQQFLTRDATLLVLASYTYHEKDYIRSREEFNKLIGK